MIPILILYLSKTFNINIDFSRMIKHIRSLANRLKVIFFLFVLMGVYANDGGGNPKLHAYKVVKNNTIIGSIKVSIDVTGDSTIYLLESAIKTKYLIRRQTNGVAFVSFIFANNGFQLGNAFLLHIDNVLRVIHV